MKKENLEKIISLEASNHDRSAVIIGFILPVIRVFDGKVFNKRLETALRRIDENIRVYYDNYNIIIKYYHEKRCVVDENGIAFYTFLKCDCLSCLTLQEAYNEKKRIVAENFIRELIKRKEMLSAEAEELREGIKVIEQKKTQLKELEEETRKIKDSIPYTLRYHAGIE